MSFEQYFNRPYRPITLQPTWKVEKGSKYQGRNRQSDRGKRGGTGMMGPGHEYEAGGPDLGPLVGNLREKEGAKEGARKTFDGPDLSDLSDLTK